MENQENKKETEKKPLLSSRPIDQNVAGLKCQICNEFPGETRCSTCSNVICFGCRKTYEQLAFCKQHYSDHVNSIEKVKGEENMVLYVIASIILLMIFPPIGTILGILLLIYLFTNYKKGKRNL